MTLLDAFVLSFGTEGLGEIAADIKDTEKKIDSLEKEEKQLNEEIKKGGKEAEKAKKKLKEINQTLSETRTHLNRVKGSMGGVILQLKNVAAAGAKFLAAFAVLNQAKNYTKDFVANVLEVAEAADRAKLSLEEYQKKTFGRAIFSKQDVINAKEYEFAMRDIRAGTAQIGANLAQLLLPAMTTIAKVTSKIVDFFAEHGTFIKAFFVGLAIVITAATIPAIINMGIALWTALAPIIVPVTAVIAAVTALALVIEDLWKWMHGEPSVAELLFGDFETIKQKFLAGLEIVIDSIKNAFDKVMNFIKPIIDAIKPLFGGKINVTTENKTVNGSHASGLDYVPFDGYVAELHKGERVQTAAEAQDWRSSLSAAKNAVNFTANYPLNSIPSGAISNAYNNSSPTKNINIGDITINTQATDAQGISFDLAKHIKQAMISLDDGMLA